MNSHQKSRLWTHKNETIFHFTPQCVNSYHEFRVMSSSWFSVISPCNEFIESYSWNSVHQFRFLYYKFIYLNLHTYKLITYLLTYLQIQNSYIWISFFLNLYTCESIESFHVKIHIDYEFTWSYSYMKCMYLNSLSSSIHIRIQTR